MRLLDVLFGCGCVVGTVGCLGHTEGEPERGASADAATLHAASTDGGAAAEAGAVTCAHPNATEAADVVAQAPEGTIQDFDIDSTSLFFTTATGTILSCPASGCVGPTLVSGSIPPFGDGGTSGGTFVVRIGLDGLVFAETGTAQRASAPPTASLDLYTLRRDGGGVRLLQHVDEHWWAMAVAQLVVEGGNIFYVATGNFPNDNLWWLEAILPAAGGGTSRVNEVTLGSVGEGGRNGYDAVALVGSTAYGSRWGPVAPYPLASFHAWADGGSPSPTYANPPVAISYPPRWSFAASSGFVACSGQVLGDGGVDVVDAGEFVGFDVVDAGGAYALFICAAGDTCRTPMRVSGVDASAITGLYADTNAVYFTDTSNRLFSCDGAAALAGSCAPKLLASPAPKFTEFRSDADHVYLLKADGSAIVRVRR